MQLSTTLLRKSMDRENKKDFIKATAMSRKRRYDVHFSDSEDTGAAQLLKIKTKPDWLKPVPEEEAPETPEPDWVLQRLGYTASNWTNSGLLLMLIFFEALEITPVDSAHLFVSPPAGDAAKKGEQKKTTSKADKPKKHAPVKQLTLAEQTKLVKEKTSKLTLSKKIRNDKVMKVRKEKRYDLLVDEEDEEPQVEDDEYNLQRGIPKDPIVNEGDTEILNVDEERGENVSNTVALEERTVELDEGHARSDPGKTPESQPPPEHVLMEEDQAGSNPGQSHVVLAGPNPEPMHYNLLIQFNASMYMKA
ncbi:hypothetical protein Tco_1175702 [Tanacetum coccineum]